MKNKNLTILIAAVFTGGIVFSAAGYLALKKAKPFLQKVSAKLKERKIADIPKAKEPLLICGFENPDDLAKWDASSAQIQLSQKNASSGKYSLEVTYKPSGGAPAVKIEKYFEKDKKITDWSAYEALSFDIFNPGVNSERVILQLKDTKGQRKKIDLQVDPGVSNKIVVGISELWDEINPSKISQFNLFLWDNRENKTFYIDNICLLPLASLQKQSKNILSDEFIPKPGEKIYATGDYFAFDSSKWMRPDAQGKDTFVRIPLMPCGFITHGTLRLPFSGGIPFPKGQLNSLANMELVNEQGNPVVFQAEVLSKWPDASIKWLGINFKPQALGKYSLCYGEPVKENKFDSKLKVDQNNDRITVDTGKLKFSLSKRNFYLFDSVWLDKNKDRIYSDNELVSSKGDIVIEHNKKVYRGSLDKDYTLEVEEQGPARSCIKAQGWFVSEKGEKFCRFLVRVYAYEGESYLKVQHTFIYTGYPENKYHYLYKGKRLPKNETIDAIYIRTPINIDETYKFSFPADNKIMQGELSEDVKIEQGKYNTYKIEKGSRLIKTGDKLNGWLDLSSPAGGLTLGVKNSPEQFPKGFLVDTKNKCIVTELWPKDAGALDLSTQEPAYGPEAVARGSAFGLAKTHDLFLYFHKDGYEGSFVKDVSIALMQDNLVCAHPEWISDTRVLGKVRHYDKRLAPAEEFLSRLFDWGARQVENFRWYGMIDFGDTLSWYRKDGYDESYDDWGWHPLGRWGWFNCEGPGTHTGVLMQFLRTMDFKYFKFGANLARHIMDIDTCHYNTVLNDKRLRNRITDDYSRVGSMHRHNANHWGGRNDEASHTNLTGIALYYYITADKRAKDVLEEIGSFFLQGRVTYYGHPDIAPLRSIANVLWGEVILYELTQDKKYKDAADKWMSLLYDGQAYDGSWSEDYNPVKKRWDGKPHLGYISDYTVPALIEYHKLTGNKAAAECITKVTDYVIKHSEYGGYFDASAYSYWLTGDMKYAQNVNARLDFTVAHQRRDNDPLWDGMIYQKAIFGRVMEYLYKTPFAFEVLTEKE